MHALTIELILTVNMYVLQYSSMYVLVLTLYVRTHVQMLLVYQNAHNILRT